MDKTSRSRLQDLIDCPRLGYLRYIRRLEPAGAALALATGRAVHYVCAALAKGTAIQPALARAMQGWRDDMALPVEDDGWIAKEQEALIYGLGSAYWSEILPGLMNDYHFREVEVEREWEMAPGLIYQLRCDAVLERKRTAILMPLELKTMASASEGWWQDWDHNPQVLSYTHVLGQLSGQPVTTMLMIGLTKGIRRYDEAFDRKIQVSPLCYLYRSKTGDLTSKWATGRKRIPVWELDRQEVEACWRAEGVLAGVVNQAPLLTSNPELCHEWERQAIALERDLERRLALPLEEGFPKNWGHCRRYRGHPCGFVELCENAEVAEDPIGSGLYQSRRGHHEQEDVA